MFSGSENIPQHMPICCTTSSSAGIAAEAEAADGRQEIGECVMKCPKCRTENRDDSKFCSNCAAPLGQVGGVGLDGATVTKTLEAPAVMLKPDALVVGKHKIVEENSRGVDCRRGQWN